MGTLERIATFYDASQALSVKAALDSQGVAGFLAGYAFASVNWHLTTAIGGIDLLVPSAETEAARAVLASGDAKSDLESSPEAFRRRPLLYATAALAALLLVGLPMPLWARHRAFYAPQAAEASVIE